MNEFGPSESQTNPVVPVSNDGHTICESTRFRCCVLLTSILLKKNNK